MNVSVGPVSKLIVVTSIAAWMFITPSLNASQTPSAQAKPRPFDEQVQALADATRKKMSHEFQTPLAPPATRARMTLGTAPDPDADQLDYAQVVLLVIQKLEEYWGAAVPQYFRQPYRPISRYHQYEPETANKGYPCFGKFLLPNNAFYCSDIHAVQWHGAWLYGKFKQLGDFAAGFIIAHEWGHSVQSHLSRNVTLNIETELQADCLAGVWSRWAQTRILEPGDLEEAIAALFDLADPKTPWLDPTGHGNGTMRSQSFVKGFRGGVPTSCAAGSK